MLTKDQTEAIARAVDGLGLDGWLLYTFKGNNPVANRMLGLSGLGSRRAFVMIPATGSPVAIAHRIELQGFAGFPGEVRPYASWDELDSALRDVVRGKRLAMETSPQDAVPYLDWVPAGVLQKVESLGGTVVTSADLVSTFSARWSAQEVRDHCEAAEIIAGIARTTLADVVGEVGAAREWAVQQRVLEAIAAAGLQTSHPPIVGFGANAANPHYEPREGSDALLEADQVVLLDLWGGKTLETPFADQTWMGFSGSTPPDEVLSVWTAVRDARDAVIERLERAHRNGEVVTGAELDDAARGLLHDRGYAEWFVHRTGHSIDRELHGSGPHLDNYETHDNRQVIPGIGFSVEPGVYLTGRFGVRSEINMYIDADGPHVTPLARQRDLILPA